MLTIGVLVAALLIAIRGVIRPFWDCTSPRDVVNRAMHLSETEWHGVLFCGVLACMAGEELFRNAL
jgi:hypothetical protein